MKVENIMDKNWKYTPVNNKRPFIPNWQHNPMGYDDALNHPGSNGIGLVLGEPSGGVMAMDFDGPEAWAFFEGAFGPVGNYPVTIAWTSGKPERMQTAWAVPAECWHLLRTIKVGEGKKLEFRWTGGQSVLPPSVHPETGAYEWLEKGQLITIPDKLLDFWIDYCNKPAPVVAEPQSIIADGNKEALVIGLIEIIKHWHPSLNYHDWLEYTYAIAKELGVAEAKRIMASYYPAKKQKEYDSLLGKTYSIGQSPGLGTLIHSAKQLDRGKVVELIKDASMTADERLRDKIKVLTRQKQFNKKLGE